MISAFISGDSGFGMPISLEQLNEINLVWLGAEYIDKVAANQVLSTTAKSPLKKTPIVCSLLIGVAKDRYWNSFHTTLQMEDVVEGLVLSSVANLVHLCGEDVGSNPAWKISGCWSRHSIPCEILCSLLGRAPGSGT